MQLWGSHPEKKKLIGKTRFGNEDHLAQKFQMLISEL
jgi:hypothetical protein